MARLDLIILNFLKEKNLEEKIKIKDTLINKINIKKFSLIKLFSIFIGKKFIINKNNKNKINGEIMKFFSLILTRTFKFFENNFNASENGWNSPIIPILLGPIRKWKIPKIFRSIIVKNAIEINIIKVIIKKLIKIFILFLNLIIFYNNFIKFIIIFEIIIILIFFFIINFINFNEILFILTFISIIVIESRIRIFIFFEFKNNNNFFFLNNWNLF